MLYLIYETKEAAIDRADEEGKYLDFDYWREDNGKGTRWLTYPDETIEVGIGRNWIWVGLPGGSWRSAFLYTFTSTTWRGITMQDIVYKSTIGTGGFIATIELGQINELLGLVVGLATLVYMTASAVKVIKELKNK